MLVRGIVAVLLSLACLSLAPGLPVVADEGDSAGCPLGFDEPGHHRYVAPGYLAIVIDFEVTGPYDGRFFYATAFAFEETLPPEAPTREAAIVSRIIEDAEGNVVDYAASRIYEEGLRVEVAGEDIGLAETPGTQCGWLASGGDPDLEPGVYRMVVPGWTQHRSEIGAFLPGEVDVLRARAITASPVDADTLACGTHAQALTPMLRPTVLLDCRMDVAVPDSARLYWTFQSEARPDDALRQATWHTAAGDAFPVSRFVVGSGGAGDYALDVPHWLAPAGHLLLGPPEQVLPPDAGIAGVVAVVG